MKKKLSLVGGILCGLLASSAAGENSSAKSTSGNPPPAAQTPPASSTSTAAISSGPAGAAVSVQPSTEKAAALRPDSAKTAAPELTESQELERAKRAHIRPVSHLIAMETPPPPPRAETKPSSPVPGLVWVPGHWTPVKSEWQWAAGEWAVPATAASVWIEPKYDSKTKLWTAGYWQPDRELLYGN